MVVNVLDRGPVEDGHTAVSAGTSGKSVGCPVA